VAGGRTTASSASVVCPPPALQPAMATSSVLISTVHLKAVAILVLVYPGVSPFNGLHLVAIALRVATYVEIYNSAFCLKHFIG